MLKLTEEQLLEIKVQKDIILEELKERAKSDQRIKQALQEIDWIIENKEEDDGDF